LSQQVANVTQLNSLYGMRAALGRMGGNLGAINASQNTVATAGGNLFSLSQKQYGDASAWTGIAKANNLTDPFVSGPQTLTIPAQADNSGGVLSA
jgi:nucleoid-associated protein YgaU